MDNLEEEFSPDRYTQKELVKHLYREVTAIHAKLDAMSLNLEGRYSKLDAEYRAEFRMLDGRLDQLEQFRASTKTILGIIGTIGAAVLGGLITLIIKVFELM